MAERGGRRTVWEVTKKINPSVHLDEYASVTSCGLEPNARQAYANNPRPRRSGIT